MDTGTVLYAKQDSTYVLKFVGQIRYTLGHALDEFLERLFAKGSFDNILIDLTEATAIDSTSLGLLAKIANFMRGRFGRKATLISSNEDINQVLDCVGFYEIFTICDDCGIGVQSAQKLAVSAPSEAALAKTVLEAHRILSELNEANRERFKNVVEAFKGELEGKS